MSTNYREIANSRIRLYLDENKAINVEKSVFNFAVKFSDCHGIDCDWDSKSFVIMYKQKLLEVLGILKDEILLQRILSKDILAKDVAFLDYSKLHFDARKKDEFDESDVAEGIFQCKKCSSKKTTYYSVQTRSSDEPMTNFITCSACKNRWKM
jgi:DNA-directed RNA polymerase subunit M/transcription elongation factor TFIIS